MHFSVIGQLVKYRCFTSVCHRPEKKFFWASTAVRKMIRRQKWLNENVSLAPPIQHSNRFNENFEIWKTRFQTFKVPSRWRWSVALSDGRHLSTALKMCFFKISSWKFKTLYKSMLRNLIDYQPVAYPSNKRTHFQFNLRLNCVCLSSVRYPSLEHDMVMCVRNANEHWYRSFSFDSFSLDSARQLNTSRSLSLVTKLNANTGKLKNKKTFCGQLRNSRAFVVHYFDI